MTYDILIRGGHVFDGSGSAGIAGDVAIDARRIAAIGRDLAHRDLAHNARRIINASGLAVAPGFIGVAARGGRRGRLIPGESASGPNEFTRAKV